MKNFLKNLKILPLFFMVLAITACSNDDDNGSNPPSACEANAGTLTADASSVSLLDGTATISATADGNITVPTDYEVTYVLTSGDNLVIEDAGANPSFTVTESGLYTIHTLVAETSDNTNSNFLDLSIIDFGTTTGGDVLGIVTENNLCASLDVAGAPINVLFTVIEQALDNGFTSLAAALTATDLVTTLQGAGPFTVFAPTNDAFDDLLDETGLDLDNLTTDQEELVRQILLNHVIVGSELDASAVTSSAPGYVNTGASGVGDTNLSLFYNLDGTTVQLNGGSSTAAGANVTMTDVQADNGVIHVINKVLSLPTIVDMALANPEFTSLVGALTTSTPSVDFVATLSTEDGTAPAPFTVFAPNNAAFAALTATPTETELIAILQHHVITGTNAVSSGLTDGMMPATLEGDTITINLPGNDNNPAKITDGSGTAEIDIIAVDVQTTNGVIHVVESVLMPNMEN